MRTKPLPSADGPVGRPGEGFLLGALIFTICALAASAVRARLPPVGCSVNDPLFGEPGCTGILTAALLNYLSAGLGALLLFVEPQPSHPIQGFWGLALMILSGLLVASSSALAHFLLGRLRGTIVFLAVSVVLILLLSYSTAMMIGFAMSLVGN